MRDSLRNLQAVHLGNLALSGVTPGSSDYVDLRGFRECTFLIVSNTITDAGAAAGFTAKMEDSADTTSAAAADVVAADTPDGVVSVAVTADTDDDKIAAGLGYIGGKRYAGVTVTGTAGTDADVSIYAILGRAHRQPTSFVGTAVART